MVLQKFRSLKDILRQQRIKHIASTQQLEDLVLNPNKEVPEYFNIESPEDIDYFFNDYYIY